MEINTPKPIIMKLHKNTKINELQKLNCKFCPT